MTSDRDTLASAELNKACDVECMHNLRHSQAEWLLRARSVCIVTRQLLSGTF